MEPKEQDVFYGKTEPQTPPRRITGRDRYVKRRESAGDSHWETRDIFNQTQSIRRALFWLCGTIGEQYVWYFINASRRAFDNDLSNYIQWQQTIQDKQQIVLAACLLDPPKTHRYDGLMGGQVELSPIEQHHPVEVKAVRGAHKLLDATKIAEHHIAFYGRLLHVEQQWAADLFLDEIPATFYGSGKIAVKHFISTLGNIIRMLRDHTTKPSDIEAEFATLEDAQTIISKIAKEEF